MKNNGTRSLAKILAYQGYRNVELIEDIHAGKWPKNAQGEYADQSEVIVTTLDGAEQILWANCSRIRDAEMKEINRSVTNNIYSLLSLIEEFNALPWWVPMPPNWDEPTHAPWYKKARRE